MRAVISTLFLSALVFGCFDAKLVSNISPYVLAPVGKGEITDGRGRFREIFCSLQKDHGSSLPDNIPCWTALWRLSNEPGPTGKAVSMGKTTGKVRVIVIPGIFSECISKDVSTLSDALAHLDNLGYKTGIIQVSGRSSSASNARQISDAIAAMQLEEGERLILVGYSKGTPDILEMLVMSPDAAAKISAVISIAGVVNGSLLADKLEDVYKSIESVNLSRCPKGDAGAVDSLMRMERMRWMSQNDLPKSIRYYSIAAFANIENTSNVLKPSYEYLGQFELMNDSQVVHYDAIIPGGTILGYANADHWAVAMPFNRKPDIVNEALVSRNSFPREILLEAAVKYVEEDLSGGRQ